MKHQITRIRHETRRRSLIVRHVAHITPQMLRLTLGGEELAGFTSASPDDHIKIFVESSGGSMEMRDYTPRHYDSAANELIVDFALHDAGPATAWAASVKPGDAARIGGPRGSAVVPYDFDWWLLVGDETAIPAIGRRIEELPAGTSAASIIAVTGPEEEQLFRTQADHQAIWVHRPAAQADDPALLLAALARFLPPPGEGFIWIAAEGGVAKALRRHVLEARQHPLQWLKASGYWVKGTADASVKLE